MKYSMEAADKYRPYMPPSTLAMSMYSPDGKYLDTTAKSYGYLDPAFTKAYFESSKLYMESSKMYNSERYSPLDLGKLYTNDGPPSHSHRSTSRSPEGEPTKQESSEPSSTSSASSTSPGALPCYYQNPASLLPINQYPQYQQASPTVPTSATEFRRPLTVIF